MLIVFTKDNLLNKALYKEETPVKKRKVDNNVLGGSSEQKVQVDMQWRLQDGDPGNYYRPRCSWFAYFFGCLL